MKNIRIALLLFCPALAAGQAYHTLFTAPPSCGHGGPPYCLTVTQLSHVDKPSAVLASFTLPAGNYLITATPVFYTLTPDATNVTCWINVPSIPSKGTPPYVSVTIQSSEPTVAWQTSTPIYGYASPTVPGAVKLSSTQAVTLFCETLHVVNVEAVTLTAARVVSLTP
jgi:hypothetical protein